MQKPQGQALSAGLAAPAADSAPANYSAAGEPADVSAAFVARQPIFDQNRKVYAYELLFRSSPSSEAYDGNDGDEATRAVIANSVFAVGLGNVLAGKPGFVNFTRELLLSGYAGVLPAANTVIEIIETVQPDEEVVRACRLLKERGYQLALDDFVGTDFHNPLTQYADIIKVDFQGTSARQQQLLAEHFRPRGIRLLAEKVETTGEFELARRLGFTLFQGYFFARPEVIRGRKLPAFKNHYRGLLRALHQPDIEYGQIEEMIKQELSLVYKLLRYINSACFEWNSKISSVRHAVVLLGAEELRKWVSLAIVAGLGEDKPAALLVTAMVRARFCELISPMAGLSDRREGLFLTGMFSVMDAILDRPMDDALVDLELAPDVRATLLGQALEENRIAVVYDLVRSYERADWDAVSSQASRLGVPEDQIPSVYVEAVEWTDRIFAH